MTLDPDGYLGRPLPDLLAALAHAGEAAAWESGQGRVELFSPSLGTAVSNMLTVVEPVDVRPGTLAMTLAEDADLPTDHPDVSIPGVVLEQFLGGGGQGWVYAGRVRDTGRLVAVKVLRGNTTKAASRAAREAAVCARIRHPNVLRVFGCEEAGPYRVVVMELIRGRELAPGLFDGPELTSCLGQLADAIAAVADSCIVHRDVKPANVLVRERDGSPVLVDFGLAVDLQVEEAGPPVISGTPYFMAPEALSDLPPEPSWDAYSLGVTAAQVLNLAPEIHGSLAALRVEKLSGAFDRRLRASLETIPNTAVASTLQALVGPDRRQRLEALAEAKSWSAV